MDYLTLHLITLELQKEVQGCDLSSIRQPEKETFLFYFSGQHLKRLLISVKPEHPRIHLVRQAYRGRGEKIISGFQSLMRQSVEGLRLIRIEKEPEERLIKFQFGTNTKDSQTDFIVMFELLGRSSNLILTDQKEKVLGYCRRLKSEFRQPIVGHPYQPPIRPKTSLFRFLIDPELDQSMVKKKSDAYKFIMDSMKGVSEEIAEEILQRAVKKGGFSHVLNEILEDYRRKSARAYIYSSLSLHDVGEDFALSRKNFILSPISLHTIVNLIESSYSTMNEATEIYYSMVVRNEIFARRKNRIGKMIRKEKARLNSNLSNLEKDRKKHENPEKFKKYGEMILAGLKTALIKEKYVELDDCYSNQERITISIEPSLSLPRNAERYFKKFRKAERGLLKIDARKDSIRKKILKLEDLEVELMNITDSATLGTMEEKCRNEGMTVGIKLRGKGTLDSDPEISGIRVYKSSDGLQILVGKTARDNMKLSFKVASQEDFWLHASGYGGAHVVVKNPASMKRMPEKTLIESAKLAAFYSSGKKEGKVEVHYSKKKYVRKGKNLPPGAVLVKKFESILVEPENLFRDV